MDITMGNVPPQANADQLIIYPSPFLPRRGSPAPSAAPKMEKSGGLNNFLWGGLNFFENSEYFPLQCNPLLYHLFTLFLGGCSTMVS